MGKISGNGGIMTHISSNYILITPAKNEETNLPDVALSVTEQIIKPLLWLIMDDGSTDKTSDIIRNLQNKYDWIKCIRLPQKPRDITFHYSLVCKKGFDYILEYCEQNNIEYEYIGLLDADTVLTNDYFHKLISQFEMDKSLGIASGGVYYNFNNKLSWEQSNINLPRGTGRLWRRDCFFDTKGYVVEPSPDSISNVKAVLYGWKIKQFIDIVEIQKRKTSGADGLWDGYIKNGWMAYYFNKNPLLVLANIIYYSTKSPYYTGFAYFLGYTTSVLKMKAKICDKEIRDYYWNKKLTEYFPTWL